MTDFVQNTRHLGGENKDHGIIQILGMRLQAHFYKYIVRFKQTVDILKNLKYKRFASATQSLHKDLDIVIFMCLLFSKLFSSLKSFC